MTLSSPGTIEGEIVTQDVITFPVTALTFEAQIELIMKWASKHLSKTVCVANVHMLIEGRKNPMMFHTLNHADLVTLDGIPLVWVIQLLRCARQDRNDSSFYLSGIAASVNVMGGEAISDRYASQS